MSQAGAVTGWLEDLRVGEQAAAQNLWEEYFRRLVGLARNRLGGLRRGPADPEDIALSAFATFCRRVEAGRFPQIADRDDLWRMLVTLTARKAINALRRERAVKRDPGTDDGPALPLVEEIVSREPTPSFAVSVAEQCRRLLEVLDDDTLRKIALLKLEGYTNPEIADNIGKSLATIERKLVLIRRIWQELDAHG